MASENTLFSYAVGKVLNSWTVLQLAVSHGFGGSESREKAEWMPLAVDQWFQENKNIESYEVEDFLADILSAEFDTVADDGSLPQIAAMICNFYKLCKEGKQEEVREKIQKLPKAALNNCARANSDEELEDEDQDVMDDSSSGQTNRAHSSQQQPQHETGACSTQPSEASYSQTNANNSTDENQNTESMDVEDADGWQVVRKGKKR